MSGRFSKAPSPQTCPSNDPANSSLSSTSEQRKLWGSLFRVRYLRPPPNGSSRKTICCGARVRLWLHFRHRCHIPGLATAESTVDQNNGTNGVVRLHACTDGEKHSRQGSVQQATAAATTACPWSLRPRDIQVASPVREIIRRSSA